MHSASCWLFVGTHHAPPGSGLARARFDPDTGTLSPFTLAASTPDPAFFVVHPSGRHLYTCNSGTPGGVTAFALDPASGTLAELNAVPSTRRGPSQLALDRSGRLVLDANYGGGYLDAIPLAPDGTLTTIRTRIQHEGRGPDPVRQTQPYVHAVSPDPSNRFVLAADLGLDRIYVYRLDAASGHLEAHTPPFASAPPRSGPRHMAWHPTGRWVYVIEELANAISCYAWDERAGTLDARQTIGTLPPGFAGENTAAEILVRADGRVVYASNRGHDSIAVFAVDERTGRLAAPAHVSSGGRTPRYMAIDPSDRWLVVANVDSDAIARFQMAAESGALTLAGTHERRQPYGLAFAPAS